MAAAATTCLSDTAPAPARANLATDGYAPLPRLLAAGEVDRLVATVERLLATGPPEPDTGGQAGRNRTPGRLTPRDPG